MACGDGPSELEEMPETAADEREQELPDYEEGAEEEDELTVSAWCSSRKGGGGGLASGCVRCEVDG